MAVSRFSIGSDKKENLAQMVQRYKMLAEPKTIMSGLFYFTLLQDWKLYKMLKSMPDHPKDTGLLQESWIPPAYMPTDRQTGLELGGLDNLKLTPFYSSYKAGLQSGKFNVYVLNKATVGEQARRKHPFGAKRKKKFSGRHNLKRYMTWVDKRTKFYTKKLRVVRQQLDSEWKKFVPEYIYHKTGSMM